MAPRFKSSFKEHQKYDDAIILHASAAELVSDNGSVVAELPDCKAAIGILDVTAAGTLVGDTLDVFIQTNVPIEGVDNWISVIHFTQVLGNGGVVEHIGKVAAETAETMFEIGTIIGAGLIRNLMGSEWRCQWAIVNGGGTHSFTFSVTLQPVG